MHDLRKSSHDPQLHRSSILRQMETEPRQSTRPRAPIFVPAINWRFVWKLIALLVIGPIVATYIIWRCWT